MYLQPMKQNLSLMISLPIYLHRFLLIFRLKLPFFPQPIFLQNTQNFSTCLTVPIPTQPIHFTLDLSVIFSDKYGHSSTVKNISAQIAWAIYRIGFESLQTTVYLYNLLKISLNLCLLFNSRPLILKMLIVNFLKKA